MLPVTETHFTGLLSLHYPFMAEDHLYCSLLALTLFSIAYMFINLTFSPQTISINSFLSPKCHNQSDVYFDVSINYVE